ncbi:MAG TPA: AMP-binding protein [Spirochaetota bacterium]|nr:AMP-binding protein [Spirochaetota bacterium]
MQNLIIKLKLAKALAAFASHELRRGTLARNLGSLVRSREIAEDMSWAELLEERARMHPERPCIVFEGTCFSFRHMDRNANRVAHLLLSLGGGRARGVAIMMGNCPAYLDVFIGAQKIGMYSVPVNTSLRGESLLYILNHSEAAFLAIDEDLLDVFIKIRNRLIRQPVVIVNREPGSEQPPLPKGARSLSVATRLPASKPDGGYDTDDICFILYTSGTTGLPKGVVYRYGKTTVKLLSIAAYALYRPSDVLYTCLPLFHGNALFLTITQGLHTGAKVVLARKFSASRFWDDIRANGVTAFNTIGAMIPILMKQPERPDDRDNRVRLTISAACPADLWPQFERRFGVRIYEGYGAVDGGGKSIMNLGNAPVGSIGRPGPGVVYRLVDREGNDVPVGMPGELIFAAKGERRSVEYFKNEKATGEKLRDGWIYTGDLVRKDEHGYLYFVGRNAEFMRIKGENVSAYEVEHAIQRHPAVLEAAVYAVPSELAEDEIMASVSLVEGRSLSERELVEFLSEDLPRFALPRFVRIVEEFPKTETQRIRKKELERDGVLPGTYDMSMGRHIAESLVS